MNGETRAHRSEADAHRREVIDRVRLWAALLLALSGVVIGIWAVTLSSAAIDENAADLATTNLGVRDTCRASNNNRPRIIIDQLVLNDGLLVAFGASVSQRQSAAAAGVERLQPEYAENGTLVVRDCDLDGVIGNSGDFYLGIPPPDLLGTDGLPHIKEPNP